MQTNRMRAFGVVLVGLVALLPRCADAFDVMWNGRSVAVHPARVSAIPMNQVWAGYQRPVEQTEMSSFVGFDLPEPGELVITPNADERTGEPIVLPLSFAPPIRREGDAWRIAVDRPRQFAISFGPAGKVLHVFANPPFVEAHAKDEIAFGPGEHHVGLIRPKSGQTIRIEEGAVVYGGILVAHAHDVRIVGRGIVDGSYLNRADRMSALYRAAVEEGLPEGFYGAEMAVTTFTSYSSTNVTVEGVTFRDPPRWTMIVRAQSRDVTIDNVKIIGCWRYNADGINACASENVTIRNSFVRSFDDCIVSRGAYLDGGTGPTRNIVAEGCVLWCDWGKNLEVWAGHKPCLIENVTYRDIACVHIDSCACDITTWFASSDTRIRNVTMENIEFDFVRPRMTSYLQKNPSDITYQGRKKTNAAVIVVNALRYGRYLGNQHWEDAQDLSGFRVRYENLSFRNFRFLGDVPKTFGRIEATTSPHTIEGITLEGLPENFKPVLKGVRPLR